MTGFYKGERCSLRVQSVLYNSDPKSVLRALTRLVRAVQIAKARDLVSTVELAWGDGSKTAVFDAAGLERAKSIAAGVIDLRYVVFGENKGTARGHNSLFESCEADFLLVMNPDVLLSPECLLELFRPFKVGNTGIVEARQLPIEHPKDYQPETGETSWASTACCLVPSRLMRMVRGFDADTFFLYCDDVDFSWRVRLAGFKVVYQPSAFVFHDKRLLPDGRWESGAAERYYSAEAALLLAHKYSRPDVLEHLLRVFSESNDPNFKKAVQEFKARKKRDELCPPIDPNHAVGEFVNGAYANHRFSL